MTNHEPTMTPEELRRLYQPFASFKDSEPSRNDYRFHGHVSGLGSTLARNLQRDRSADPNLAPAMRTAALLQRHLEALMLVHGLAPAVEPDIPRPMPAAGDMSAMLSDAGRDARYIKSLLAGGGGMATGANVVTALRVVRALSPKLDAICSLCEALSEPGGDMAVAADNRLVIDQ